MSTVVVLFGPPGSGKSTVGFELERLGLRWCEWEVTILRRWGSRAHFVANKVEGLQLLHDEMLAFIDAPGPPSVIETTGLSDAQFLDDLRTQRDVLCVRLDVSEEEAARRVEARTHGRHLTDDVDASRAIWHAFYDHAAPQRIADLVIDTEQTPAPGAATQIMAALDQLASG